MLLVLGLSRLIPFRITPKVIKKFPCGNKYLTYYKNLPRIIYLLKAKNNGKIVAIKDVYTQDKKLDLWYHALVVEGCEDNLCEIIDHKISPILSVIPDRLSLIELLLTYTYNESEGFIILEFGVFKKGVVKQHQRKNKLKDILN